jgi:hypothetical protein
MNFFVSGVANFADTSNAHKVKVIFVVSVSTYANPPCCDSSAQKNFDDPDGTLSL